MTTWDTAFCLVFFLLFVSFVNHHRSTAYPSTTCATTTTATLLPAPLHQPFVPCWIHAPYICRTIPQQLFLFIFVSTEVWGRMGDGGGGGMKKASFFGLIEDRGGGLDSGGAWNC